MRTLVTGAVSVSVYGDGRVRVDRRNGELIDLPAAHPQASRVRVLAALASGHGLEDDAVRAAAWQALRTLR